MKRPTSISVISVLFLIVGAVAGFQILNSLFNNNLYLDSGVLMIPVGLGLLKGRHLRGVGRSFGLLSSQ